MPQTTKDTPMMKQYQAVKDQYPDAFLFYRLGDFYELFFDDAVKGSQLLELTLTARNKSATDPIPMCGVPHRAAQQYIDVLVDKGYKVAICEQMEDPKLAQGMVKREVIQLVTPGTAVSVKVGGAKNNNYLAALTKMDNLYGLAYVDVSTGELNVTQLPTFESVITELMGIRSKEVVLDQTIDETDVKKLTQLNILISHENKVDKQATISFAIQRLDAKIEVHAVGILIHYLTVTQKRPLAHIQIAVSYKIDQYLKMDQYSKANLEISQSIRTGKKSGTLLWLLDETQTAMGGRLLKRWLDRPLLSYQEITERQQKVAFLIQHFFERDALQSQLKEVYDLERLAGRVAFGSINARDLKQLEASLNQIPKIKETLTKVDDGTFKQLIDGLDPVAEIRSLIETAIMADPPISVTDGGVIQDGFDETLDQYRDAMKNAKQWLATMEQEERKITGIHNLKIGFNRPFGYYLEVTKANLANVPEGRYERKQTLTNAERFITPELKDKEALILEAEEKSTALEYQLFTQVREQVKQSINRIQRLAKVVSTLDVLQSFAVASEQYHFVQPEMLAKGHTVDVAGGRHPVVEKVLGAQKYIPNDVKMDDQTLIYLITGPNMSGKSTYMRQFALMVIMAQIGCFVPAQSAKLPIFDQIFTRIGAADDLISGQSTFMVEMMEANQALLHATENSLILFDEIGRGTATYDGMALAQAIIEYIHENVKAKTLFSTHYHELTSLADRLPHLKNIHVGAVEENGTLVFLHKMLAGPADKSYGIHVAKLAGLPDSLLVRANQVLMHLEAENNEADREAIQESMPTFSVEPAQNPNVADAKAPHEVVDEQLALFNVAPDKPISKQSNKVIHQLKETNLMGLTPMAAMNLLYSWQQQLNKD